MPGTCTLLIRIGKDFGDGVLPLDDGYEDKSRYPAVAWFNWSEAFLATDYLLGEILERGHDLLGWQNIPMQGWPATAMYIPTASRMSRQWAGWSQGNIAQVVGAHNPTGNAAGEVEEH